METMTGDAISTAPPDADALLYTRAKLDSAADLLDGDTADLIRMRADAILRLKGRIKGLQDDVAAEYAAAKSEGLDKPALTELVRRLQCDAGELADLNLTAALYEAAYHSAKLRARMDAEAGAAGFAGPDPAGTGAAGFAGSGEDRGRG
jgi:uncharacterized protein (UPF0335 family)